MGDKMMNWWQRLGRAIENKLLEKYLRLQVRQMLKRKGISMKDVDLDIEVESGSLEELSTLRVKTVDEEGNTLESFETKF
jgi:hypothetical protein